MLVSAFAALAAAAPRPQAIDFGAVNEAEPATLTGPPPTAVSQDAYNSAQASAAAAADMSSDPLVKRQLGVNDPCGVQPDGFGPRPETDSVEAFLAYQPFADAANAAAANPPSGYTTVFKNLQGSVSANTYLGLTTLTKYDAALCQQLCDSKDLCTGFNIFFERNPTVNPAPETCPNPPSFTNVKCTLWGSPITAEVATNMGQWRTDFQVVITGSNGYVKANPPSSIPEFEEPEKCDGAIDAPVKDGKDTNLGGKFYNKPYDPLICASACQALTAKNRGQAKKGVYEPCNYFNAYVLMKNNKPKGIYCSFYTVPWDKTYGTKKEATEGSDKYTISSSYGYKLKNQDAGTV